MRQARCEINVSEVMRVINNIRKYIEKCISLHGELVGRDLIRSYWFFA